MDMLPTSSNIVPKLLPPDSNMLIHKWQIRLLDVVGQGYGTIILFGPAHESVYCRSGEFGVVYKSHLLQVRDGDDITIVAVKTLKGDPDS